MTFPTAADWLARADEARALAQRLVEPSARATMLGIAEGYEKLARHAALWAQKGLTLDEPAD